MELPKEFFTVTSISSLGVAASMINVTVNTLYKIFRLNPQKTAFVASFVVSLLNVATKKNPHWIEWILVFFNTCLIFCTTVGMNEFISMNRKERTDTLMNAQSFEGNYFFRSWMKK